VACGFCTARSIGPLTHSLLLSRKFDKELYVKLFIWNSICLQTFMWRDLNWCYRLHKNTVFAATLSGTLYCLIHSSFPICVGAVTGVCKSIRPYNTQRTLGKVHVERNQTCLQIPLSLTLYSSRLKIIWFPLTRIFFSVSGNRRYWTIFRASSRQHIYKKS